MTARRTVVRCPVLLFAAALSLGWIAPAHADNTSSTAEVSASDAAAQAALADFLTRSPSEMVAYGGRVVPPMESSTPAAEPAAEHRVWEHALPFYAQRVIDRGIDLPNPYDTGLTLYFGSYDFDIDGLHVAFNGGEMQDAGFVHFDRTHINTRSAQAQLGAWIFPFLNAYAIVGYVHGEGEIDISIAGDELMNFVGVPGCNLPEALRPQLCSQTLHATAHPDYDGKSIGAGFTLAGAWKRLFFSLPATYVVTYTSMSDSPSKTWNISPRVGFNQKLPIGMLTPYVGATYLESTSYLTGSFNFDTADTAIGRDTSLAFRIRERQVEPWNYLVGGHWMISKRWSVLAEYGFGGTRDDAMLTAFYRW